MGQLNLRLFFNVGSKYFLEFGMRSKSNRVLLLSDFFFLIKTSSFIKSAVMAEITLINYMQI